jgi:hypothetical protein
MNGGCIDYAEVGQPWLGSADWTVAHDRPLLICVTK